MSKYFPSKPINHFPHTLHVATDNSVMEHMSGSIISNKLEYHDMAQNFCEESIRILARFCSETIASICMINRYTEV